MNKKKMLIVIAIFALIAFCPGLCLAETIDPTTSIGQLLSEIIDLLTGTILLSVTIISVVCFGLAIALIPVGHDFIKRAITILFGLAIAVGGPGWLISIFGLGMLI